MWESIKNKFKRKKHVEEVEEAVVNEEEQAEEKTEALAGDENTTDKSYEPDMAVESTESKDTDDSETEEKNLQEIKPDDISDDAKEKEETVSENLKNDEEVIYETSEFRKKIRRKTSLKNPRRGVSLENLLTVLLKQETVSFRDWRMFSAVFRR